MAREDGRDARVFDCRVCHRSRGYGNGRCLT